MDSEKQKGCSSTAAASTSNLRASRKRKISKSCDVDGERPLKRHVPQVQPSPTSESQSPSGSPYASSSDDEAVALHRIVNTKAQTISSGGANAGECSSSLAASQRDSQTVYSSSVKSSVNSKSNRLVPVEGIPSPAQSSNDAGEASDFDVIPDNLGYVDSPIDFAGMFSPLEAPKLCDDEAGFFIKGDKTPHSLKKRSSKYSYKTKIGEKTGLTCYVTPIADQRLCPLPMLPWAQRESVWSNMSKRDEKASVARDSNMFAHHDGLNMRMRSILLDWLIEVCEVYKLHRETYYLTVDYLDRYLTSKLKISKNQLQLIGITCLFIASKVEEIYPPKLHEFAYVTDSACSEDDILAQEVLILQELDWSITPVTIMGWVSIYMQLNDTTGKTDGTGLDPKALLLLNSSKWSQSFIYPQFSGLNYVRTAQLCDLASLDVGMGDFPYSIIAAAAVSHTLGRSVATKVSGLSWEQIALCAKWMEPYHQILEEEGINNPIKLMEMNEQLDYNWGVTHVCPNLNRDPSHIIQTHSTSLELFDKGVLRREQLELSEAMAQDTASPATSKMTQVCPPGILTPPASNRKSLGSQTGFD